MRKPTCRFEREGADLGGNPSNLRAAIELIDRVSRGYSRDHQTTLCGRRDMTAPGRAANATIRTPSEAQAGFSVVDLAPLLLSASRMLPMLFVPRLVDGPEG